MIGIEKTDNKILLELVFSKEPDFWPFRFFNELCGYKNCNGGCLNANIVGICEVINDLPEFEQLIIMMRFKDCLRRKQIGEKFDLPGEKIRQIEYKILRKLRRPPYIDKMVSVSRASLNEIKLANKLLTDELNELKSIKSYEYLSSISIYDEKLNFSTRIISCLMRAAIDNLYELSNKSIPELMKIRNFGRACLKEVVAKLKTYDITLKDPDHVLEKLGLSCDK
jgi:hypothetical protein